MDDAMKKVILSLFLISSVFMLNAVTDSADIVLNLKEGDGTYEFGFSKTEVETYSSPVTPPGEYQTIEIGENFTGSDDSVFFFWKILSDHKIELSLSISGPLTDGSNQIDWAVRWDRKDQIPDGRLSSYESDLHLGPQIVYTYDRNSNIQNDSASSVRLIVNTDSVIGKVLGTYTGTVTATIKDVT